MKRETLKYLAFGAILILLAFTYFYQGGAYWGPCKPYMERGMMGSGMCDGQGFFGLGFHGFGIFFWLMVIFFLFLVLSGNGKQETAVDILNKRFASGEITREEYQRMKDEILEGKEETS